VVVALVEAEVVEGGDEDVVLLSVDKMLLDEDVVEAVDLLVETR
jgi:hypothetical protein